MKPREKKMFTLYKNNSGFSLMELMVVIAIIGILAIIAVQSMMATRTKVIDAAALSETREMGKAILNAFLDGVDVNLFHREGDGSAIGAVDTAGNVRTPIFTLSNNLQAEIDGNSDWNNTGLGKCSATVWHPSGTKSYVLIIDEEADEVSFPTS